MIYIAPSLKENRGTSVLLGVTLEKRAG